MNITSKFHLCHTCGNSHTFPYTSCLNCLLAGLDLPSPAHALATRDLNRMPFSASAFLNYATGLKGMFNTNSLSETDTIIIKACEQVGRDGQHLEASSLSNAKRHVRKSVSTSVNSGVQEKLRQRGELIDRLVHQQNHTCRYCQQYLDKRDACADVILPVGLDHTRVAPRVKLAFWNLARHAGLAAAACPPCNHRKTRMDIAGANLWKSVREHGREFEPVPGLSPRRSEPGIAYVARRDEAATHALDDEPPAHCILALRDLTLRFVRVCAHGHNRPLRLALAYAPELRTFYFSCGQCPMPGVRLGWLRKLPPPCRLAPRSAGENRPAGQRASESEFSPASLPSTQE